MSTAAESITRLPTAGKSIARYASAINPADDLAAVPAELRSVPRWVCWQDRDGVKVPINPHTRRAIDAKSSRLTFSAALSYRQAGRCDGIGLVLSEEDDLACIDLDDCRDPETGELTPEAMAIVRELDSYTEVSPSGRGLHVWARGDVPSVKRPGVEIYSSGRYIATTGRHLEGTPATVARRPRQLFALYERTRRDEQTHRDERAREVADAKIIWPTGSAGDLDTAQRCLASLAASRCDDYHQWVAVGHALQGGLGDAGLPLWEAWSSASAKYKPGECAVKWRSFDTHELGLGSLVYWARQDCGEMPSGNGNGNGHNGHHDLTSNFALPADLADAGPLAARLAELEAQNLRLRERLAEVRQELEREREARHRMLAILRNGDLGPRRLALAATFDYIASASRTARLDTGEPAETDEQGRVAVNLTALGERAGCKAPAVSSALAFAEANGLLKRTYAWKAFTRPDGTKFDGKLLMIEPIVPADDAMGWLSGYERQEPERRGGKRARRCPDHPTADLVHAQKWICTTCGRIVDDARHVVRPDEPGDANFEGRESEDEPEQECAVVEVTTQAGGEPACGTHIHSGSVLLSPRRDVTITKTEPGGAAARCVCGATATARGPDGRDYCGAHRYIGDVRHARGNDEEG